MLFVKIPYSLILGTKEKDSHPIPLRSISNLPCNRLPVVVKLRPVSHHTDIIVDHIYLFIYLITCFL